MSILLETLNHQDKEQQLNLGTLPNVHSSHYDDEMLGDEWLQQRLKKWRLISLFLLIALVFSWSYFWLISNISISPGSENEQELIVSQSSPFSVNSQETKNETVQSIEQAATVLPVITSDTSDSSNDAAKSATTREIKNTNMAANKQVYVPQKRVADKPTQQNKIINPSTLSKTPDITPNKTVKESNNRYIELAIYKEELPVELQQEFPLIAINSYVVADEPEKSFVILDGAFYKINQMITTDLVLRQITLDHIVVEFKSQLVKIKLK